MAPYYDFECPNNHITELRLSFAEYRALPEDDEKKLATIFCAQCISKATRIFTRPAMCHMNYVNGERH